jgi:hypothetical protein
MKAIAASHDPLFELERMIARRADELARQEGCGSDGALKCWQRAEEEVWREFVSATQACHGEKRSDEPIQPAGLPGPGS